MSAPASTLKNIPDIAEATPSAADANSATYDKRQEKQEPSPVRVDVCGKRTLEYVIEALSRLNRLSSPNESITLRSVGANIAKGVGVSQILCNHFNFVIGETRISPVKIRDVASSCLELRMKPPSGTPAGRPLPQYSSKNGFVDFPIYHLLFDMLLRKMGELRILKPEYKESVKQTGKELIKIRKTSSDFSCTVRNNVNEDGGDDFLERITAAYYRCGLVLSPEWERIGNVVSEFDDVIIGIDTNILLRAVLSEQFLNSLFLISPRAYVHTPNWVLIVIPNAVIHELEQGANSRNDRGLLYPNGRLAFRALEEILELNRNADISGVSLMIVGDANPVLDTRVELQALREDFSKRDKRDKDKEAVRLSKKSSCDMIIRAQFKEFLRQIDFHKGIFFLTADKSNAALARAEGLRSIYYKSPSEYRALGEVEAPKITCGGMPPIQLLVPLGRLIYELSVEFGKIEIQAPRWGTIEIACDAKGESLDHWLQREILMPPAGFKKLLDNYEQSGGISLAKVNQVWNETMDLMLGSEVVS